MTISQILRLLDVSWRQRFGDQGEEGVVTQVKGRESHVGTQIFLLNEDDATQISRGFFHPLAVHGDSTANDANATTSPTKRILGHAPSTLSSLLQSMGGYRSMARIDPAFRSGMSTPLFAIGDGAGVIIADQVGTAETMTVTGDAGVPQAEYLFTNRNSVYPGDEMEGRQPSVDLVNAIGPYVHRTVSVNETQARVEVGLRKNWESIIQTRRLARDVLKLPITSEFTDASHAPQAEAAFTVIDDGWNLCCHRRPGSKVIAAVVCGYGYMVVCSNSQYILESEIRQAGHVTAYPVET